MKLNKKLYRNVDEFLNSLGGDFEQSNFEQNFNFGVAGTALGSAIKSAPIKSQAIIVDALRQAMSKPSQITARIGDGSPAVVQQYIAESVGDLNLTVTRTGVNVDAPLPFILFGANDFGSGYASTLRSLLVGLPNGTTLAVTSDVYGNTLFTYTLGGNDDIVKIENLGNVNYKTFISSMNNNFFATKYLLLTLSDANSSAEQFAQPLLFGKLSALGMSNANQLVLRSRQQSWNYQRDKIEVIMPEQPVTPDFSFAMSIIAVDGLSIGFDFFMSRRLNLNNA